MLRKASTLYKRTLHTKDKQEIGSIHDFYFNEENWTVRYAVVDIGAWLFGRRVLVATSAPWDADPDLLAPGAFDRVLFLGPPTRADRLDFLRRLCAGKPQGNLDLPTLAGATEGYSFLDLKRVVDRALDDVLRRSLDQGRPQPLTRGDLESAIAAIQPSLPPWLEEAREHLPPRGQDSVYRELRSYLDAFS